MAFLFDEQKAEEIILLELTACCSANIHQIIERPFRQAVRCMALDCGKKPDTGGRRYKLHTEFLTPSSFEPRTFLRQQC